MFFVISIFVVVKERVVNSKCIFMFFLVFVRHFAVYLSELFGSEFVRAAIFICFSLFILELWIYLSLYIYLSIYLPTSNLPTNLSVRSYLSKFIKSSLISRNSTIYQNRLSWNSDSKIGFMQTLLGCVDMYCHQKLLCWIHKV